MKAVIFASCEGERLRPLTCNIPKARIDILGKPLIFYILDELLQLNISEVLLVLGYKATEIESLFPDNIYKGMQVSFIIEDENSKDAALVKNAVYESDDTLLIITEPSYFEFDLSEALSRHITNKNDATIIAKRVLDPREYGVLSLNENSEVIEIVEKPNWSDAFSDVANCGIYYLNKSILDEIPESRRCDFSKDVFPLAIEKNFKVGAYLSEEYWCEIQDIDSYKSLQFDILNKKTKKHPPFVAESVFTKTAVPSGNFVIVPPVFLGDNVQLESGAVIGPFAIIGDGSLVSKGSKIRESILGKSVYTSSGCNVNGAIICDGASLKKGASIFPNVVVGVDSVIGEAAVLVNDILVWPNKTIENGVVVTENVKYSFKSSSFLKVNDIIFGDFGVELTPEKTARLGSAIGTLFEGIRVGIGTDGENNSLSLKYGLLGGLISVGAKTFDLGTCFFSQMFYYSVFCDVDIVVFIKGGENGVSISLCEKGGVELSFESSRKIEQILKQNEFNRCSVNECHSVNELSKIGEMYINEIARQFQIVPIDFSAMVVSGNKEISNVIKALTQKLAIKENDDVIIKINDSGTKVSINENGESFSHEKILAVVANYELKKGNDVFLPWDAPEIITTLAKNLGRKALNSRNEKNSDSESKMSSVNINQLWSRDAIFLIFKLIKIITDEKKSIKALALELPEFYVAKKVMEIDTSPAVIKKGLLDNNFKRASSGVVLKNEKGVVRVKSESNGKKLKIITEAVNAEVAEEFLGDIERLININFI